MTDRSEDGAEERRAHFVGFAGMSRIAFGELRDVAAAAKRALDKAPAGTVLIFDRETAEIVDVDLRGAEKDVAARLAPSEGGSAKRGRPKLGVVAREVTLLPRHWEWLARQPGGASVALRRLVEEARKSGAEADEARMRTEAAYRFMSAMAGDLPGFEEAARALFAGDPAALRSRISGWPPDIRDETLRFVGG